MRLGLNLAVFGDRGLRKALIDAVEAGAEAVELPVHGGSPFFEASQPSVADIAAAVDAAREVGLQVSALDNHVDSHALVSNDRSLANASLRRFRHCLEAAGQRKVPIITCFFGEVQGSHWFRWPDVKERKRAFQRLAATWKPMLEEASQADVLLAHEPHPRQSAFDLESCLTLLNAVEGHPAFGINLDVGNLMASHGDPLEFVEHLGHRIAHLHAKDYRPQRNPACRDWSFAIAGTGVADWSALRDQTRHCSEDLVWSLEHEDPSLPRNEGVRLGLQFLASLRKEREKMEVWW
jgi:sugar phosphate isomerase/epimerase